MSFPAFQDARRRLKVSVPDPLQRNGARRSVALVRWDSFGTKPSGGQLVVAEVSLDMLSDSSAPLNKHSLLVCRSDNVECILCCMLLTVIGFESR